MRRNWAEGVETDEEHSDSRERWILVQDHQSMSANAKCQYKLPSGGGHKWTDPSLDDEIVRRISFNVSAVMDGKKTISLPLWQWACSRHAKIEC
jgi:hypothetical protein